MDVIILIVIIGAAYWFYSSELGKLDEDVIANDPQTKKTKAVAHVDQLKIRNQRLDVLDELRMRFHQATVAAKVPKSKADAQWLVILDGVDASNTAFRAKDYSEAERILTWCIDNVQQTVTALEAPAPKNEGTNNEISAQPT